MENFVNDLLFKEESFKLVGLCMKIHGKLGKGFKEIVYKDALKFEMKNSCILYEREKSFSILYNGITLPHHFVVDFLVYNSIIPEVKSA
jgi:GxxExxY protein